MERWSGRVAIVTGATSGIGKAIARLLVRNSMKVVAFARREEKLQELAEELQGAKGELHLCIGDVTKEEDVQRAISFTKEKLGGVSMLVNNAEVHHASSLLDTTVQHMQHILDVNVLGLCVFTHEVIKDMMERGVENGHIFHINSITGHCLLEHPRMNFYTGSKHMVTVLTESLRRELRDLKPNIKVTIIKHSLANKALFTTEGMSAGLMDHTFGTLPHLQPEDVAAALVYALSTPPHVQVHELTIQAITTI